MDFYPAPRVSAQGTALGLAGEAFTPEASDAGYSSWWVNTFNPKYADQKFNAAQAAIQRQWEERMSSTAYQRSVADLRKAGLNPYLLYGSASPASTPTASMAHSSGDNFGVVRGVADGLANAFIGVLRIAAYAAAHGL